MKSAILHLTFAIAAAFALPSATHAAPTLLGAEPLDGLWGVNYYAPFALDYCELARRGFDHKAAIRDDVAHFRRLGLDLLRIHCFDRQISRRDGALADTVHLELLDYLVSVAASNGMRTVLTPIAWYGWSPMDDVAREGFSNIATMQDFTSRRDLWPLQAKFLAEFAAHTNRYTGLPYGVDPTVVAFECVNEPLYPDRWPQTNVTAYIDTLVNALRKGGATQPIFYNSFNGYNEAAGASIADGVSCCAYPLGLLAGRPLVGPQLAKIRESTLKPDTHIAGKRRMAYEFDAADTLDSCLYPAIAKMLRGEGVELAAQFQYDPLALADENRNWHTHYLNLVYTPRKALSLLIAGRAFKAVPRGKPFASDAHRIAFPPFLVDADRNLSEMATDSEYFYSNDPVTPPPRPAALRRVYGCGRSSVAASDGSGAYFLDKAADGLWRLQLYPNVITVANPFSGVAGVKTEIVPGDVALTLHLPDLGDRYAVRRVRDGAVGAIAVDGCVILPPGDYVLTRDAGDANPKALKPALRLAEVPPYVAPPIPQGSATPRLHVLLPTQWRAGVDVPVRVEGIFADDIKIEVKSSSRPRGVATFPVSGATLPASLFGPGPWLMAFSATGRYGGVRFPADGWMRLELADGPDDWNYLDASLAVAAGPEGAAIRRKLVADNEGRPAIRVSSDGFAAKEWSVLQFRCSQDAYDSFFPSPPTGTAVVVRAHAATPSTTAMEIVLVEPDLKSWRYRIPLTEEWRDIRIPADSGKYCGEWPWVPPLKPGTRPDVRHLACMRLEFGASLYGSPDSPKAFEVSSVRVE
jgi:hypothetical protein